MQHLIYKLILVCLMLQLGSLLSIYGCYQHHKKATGDKVDNVDGDTEQGIYDASALPQRSNPLDHEKILGAPEEVLVRTHAGFWGYMFQIIFQVHFSIFIRSLIKLHGIIRVIIVMSSVHSVLNSIFHLA